MRMYNQFSAEVQVYFPLITVDSSLIISPQFIDVSQLHLPHLELVFVSLLGRFSAWHAHGPRSRRLTPFTLYLLCVCVCVLMTSSIVHFKAEIIENLLDFYNAHAREKEVLFCSSGIFGFLRRLADLMNGPL